MFLKLMFVFDCNAAARFANAPKSFWELPVLGVAMDLAFVFALNRLVMGGAVFFVTTLSTLLGELLLRP